VAILIDQKVVGFQVAMDVAHLMQHVHGNNHLCEVKSRVFFF
jgi:hypothetical protein